MNYLWTIQKKSVIEIIESNGCYYPNFKYKNKKCNKAYQFILNCFNQINESDYAGLVFGFAKKGVDQYFGSVNELYQYFMDNPLITDAFDLWNEEYVILQLQYTDLFNMIPVDFNDFIQIMPPIWDPRAYSVICSCLEKGVYLGGYTLPSFTQVHMPYIKKDNIVHMHGNFDKKKSAHTEIL